jgi:gag-polyprotein putative aspartyl protease
MQKTKRLVASLGLVASLLSLRCVPRAVFPEGSPAVVLPLRDPLLVPDPSVLATLPGRDGPWSAWMYSDSGDPEDGAILPRASVARLGPAYVDRGATRIPWIWVREEDARWGLLSSLALGDLVMRDVPVRVTGLDLTHSPSGILGQAVLGHAPWEIDWDRGTLTLGATPWPDAPDAIVVPLRRRKDMDVVTVQVDGHPVEMVVDTGAPFSVIPADIARDAGLSVHDVDRRHHPAGQEVSGDAVLGPLRLGRIDFASVPHVPVGYGLLGLDVLSRYRIQVVPGERLALRPRGDPWESAPQRIARWPWTRACRSLGCIRARLEPVGDDARLAFSFEVDVPHPVGLLLGCREADPAGSRLPTMSERATSGRSSGPAYHISLRVASAVKDQAVETLMLGGNQWLSRTGCREISVLDVVPISLDKIPGGAVFAALMF